MNPDKDNKFFIFGYDFYHQNHRSSIEKCCVLKISPICSLYPKSNFVFRLKFLRVFKPIRKVLLLLLFRQNNLMDLKIHEPLLPGSGKSANPIPTTRVGGKLCPPHYYWLYITLIITLRLIFC